MKVVIPDGVKVRPGQADAGTSAADSFYAWNESTTLPMGLITRHRKHEKAEADRSRLCGCAAATITTDIIPIKDSSRIPLATFGELTMMRHYLKVTTTVANH
jgi:hypothetical protein